MPMMNFRLARPAVVVDINRIGELDRVGEEADALVMGALARQRAVERWARAEFPLLATALRHVGHDAIRTRGTIAGSLAHADPAAELPALLLCLDGHVRARSARGERTIAARDLFVSALPFQATNGWGPVERDTSNGEQAAGDGRPIALDGTMYARGLGAHAPGDVTMYLGHNCTSFTAVVGIDDEAGASGSVRYHVLVDNREVASTDIVTGTSAPVSLTADITGGDWLDLVVDEAGDGNGLDHADWADAMIHCN